MRLRVVDFETTGAEGSEVIEAGFVDVERCEGGWRIGEPQSQFFSPFDVVSVQARAVHHIPDAALQGAPRSSPEAVERYLTQGEGVDAYVAHSAAFECSFLPRLSKSPWICTAKTARRAWPQAPGYSNQVLRYWLELNLDPSVALPAHRAGPDAYVTAHILQNLLQTETVATLLEWTTQPAVVSFGKHKGRPWDEVPSAYLHWMMGEQDMSEHRLAAARRELDRRATDLAIHEAAQ